jgi:hypothetical protein
MSLIDEKVVSDPAVSKLKSFVGGGCSRRALSFGTEWLYQHDQLHIAVSGRLFMFASLALWCCAVDKAGLCHTHACNISTGDIPTGRAAITIGSYPSRHKCERLPTEVAHICCKTVHIGDVGGSFELEEANRAACVGLY